MSPAWSAVTYGAAVAAPVLAWVVWSSREDLRFWWTGWRYKGQRRKPRRPGTDLAVRRVPFGDMLEPKPEPGFWQGDPASGDWEGPGTIRTAKVGGVHLPLSDDTPGDPHYAWLDRQAQNVPLSAPGPAEGRINGGHGQGHPGFWPGPPDFDGYLPRTMARDLDITVIDSLPRISGGRDCTRPYGYQHERHQVDVLRAAITSGAAW